MFESWGQIIFRRRRLVLVIALAGVLLGAVWGTRVFSSLQSAGGFTPPASQSQQEANLAALAFGPNADDVVLLYSSKNLTVHSPAYRSAVAASLARLPRSRVTSEQTYWSAGSAPRGFRGSSAGSMRFVSVNGRVSYAVLGLAGNSDSAKIKSWNAIKGDLSGPARGATPGTPAGPARGATPGTPAASGLTIQAGGQIPTEAAINSQVSSDIGRAEMISLPILLVLLLLIFGSLAAASLPLAIGGVGIIGSFTVLRLLTLGTPVSIYSINITTILGLGLAIDYGLFMVGRFREELNRQPTVEMAVARTVATAGRTVAVSGITVAMALASLLLFPEVFLRSMGYGGVGTVLVDMLAALTVMPALLSVLGPRVNALRVRRSVQRPRPAEGRGGWYRLARSVMRAPLAYASVIVLILLALGTPFLSIHWGGTDARALPAGAQARVVSQALSNDFPGNVGAPIESIVRFGDPLAGPAGVPGVAPRASAAAERTQLAGYVTRLDRVPGVLGAQVTGMHGDMARIDMGYAPDPVSAQARQIVQGVRGVAAPAGARAYTGGETAQTVDELSSMSATLPWMALVMATATFVLLFLAFGSVVLPVKAIVMNVLSLSATFGVVVWIFQQGHLAGLLGFLPTGNIDPQMPILMLAIIFGLSMDYEVFLLSRIRERYDQTGDNTEAVASGLQRTGGVITSAALLLLIVIGAFSASGITFIKLLGVGMIVALVVDASIVRIMLVPAVMRMLGRANWWAPRPLRRLYARYGIREAGTAPAGPRVAAGTR